MKMNAKDAVSILENIPDPGDALYAVQTIDAIRDWWSFRKNPYLNPRDGELYTKAQSVYNRIVYEGDDGKRHIHPYARQTLRNNVRVSSTEILTLLDIGKTAARDIVDYFNSKENNQ